MNYHDRIRREQEKRQQGQGHTSQEEADRARRQQLYEEMLRAAFNNQRPNREQAPEEEYARVQREMYRRREEQVQAKVVGFFFVSCAMVLIFLFTFRTYRSPDSFVFVDKTTGRKVLVSRDDLEHMDERRRRQVSTGQLSEWDSLQNNEIIQRHLAERNKGR